MSFVLNCVKRINISCCDGCNPIFFSVETKIFCADCQEISYHGNQYFSVLCDGDQTVPV